MLALPRPVPTLLLSVVVAAALFFPTPHNVSADVPSPPARLVIPAIGVDAAVDPVGDAPDGAMDIAPYPDDVAWYEPGPVPGGPGNAFIAGHVDWGGKLRVFWHLKDLAPGDSITVVASDGTEYHYTVTETQMYDATAPAADVFWVTDDPELTLITCGGEFDRATRHYLSRVVVRATLQ